MNVFLNSEEINTDGSTLYSLLHSKDFVSKKGIAVAVNNKVVPRNNWETTELYENDKVLVISATKGG